MNRSLTANLQINVPISLDDIDISGLLDLPLPESNFRGPLVSEPFGDGLDDLFGDAPAEDEQPPLKSFATSGVCPVPYPDEGLILSVDSSEQLPWEFLAIPAMERHKLKDGADSFNVQTKRYNIPWGDYAIHGAISSASIERKSLSDLFHTIGQERERFKRDLFELDRMPHSFVVVEATLAEVCDPTLRDTAFHSRLHPHSVMGFIQHRSMDCPHVHWHFAGSRRLAEIWTFYLLESLYLQCKRHWKLKETADILAKLNAEAAGR